MADYRNGVEKLFNGCAAARVAAYMQEDTALALEKLREEIGRQPIAFVDPSGPKI